MRAEINQEQFKMTMAVNINNTQNFYNPVSSPYEEQKQAKQQLRRLAYGI